MKRTLAYTATLLAGVSIAATAQARPMTPEDVAKIESVGAVSVAPDGSRIAYTTAHIPDVTEGEDNGVTRQRLMIAQGPNVATAYLPDDISASGVAFSPVAAAYRDFAGGRRFWVVTFAVSGSSFAVVSRIRDSQHGWVLKAASVVVRGVSAA